MGKKSKVGKARKDRFYFLAKETGFRSRAAFKLIQLNRRFGFLNSSKVLIDLCAAPGGWLQVSSKEMPVSSVILGVDLVPIQPIPRVKTFVADITTERCKQLIRSELLQNKADVVLHDGAPNVGTAWSIDEYGQAHLCLQAFALATDFLRKGGWFITKVFRSRDYEPLKWVLSQFFHTLRAVKPEASRMESAEIFLVGQSYRAPDRIDKRFLDPRHVFGEVEQVKNRAEVVASLLKECKRKRKAEGYADGDSLYHELPVSDFLRVSDPLEALAKANKVVLDLKEVSNHPLTTEAIKADLEDIQVLGKSDIRQILKWRKKILEALDGGSDKQVEPLESEITCVPETAPEDPDEDNDDVEIEEEVQRVLHEEAKDHKKRLKRVRRAKMKLAERLVLKMEHPGDRIEDVDAELFSLSTIHDLIGLEKAQKLFGDTSQTGVDDQVRKENKLALKELRSKRENEERSAIEGSKRVRFERRGDDADPPEYAGDNVSGKRDSRDDLYFSSNDEGDGEDDMDFNDIDLDSISVTRPPKRRVKVTDTANTVSKDERSLFRVESEQTNSSVAKKLKLPRLPEFSKLTHRQNPLLVDLDDSTEEAKRKRKIQSWLGSDEMKALLAPVTLSASSNDSSDSDSGEKRDLLRKKKKKKKRADRNNIEANAGGVTTEASAASVPSTASNPPDAASSQSSTPQMKRLRRPLTAEEKALALRLIRSAKSRRELIESNYHRMQFFEDPSELPDWFVDDERKHMRKPLPLTKEELPVSQPTMGRSIKKVEEAKRRKKARLDKRLKRIRQKAEDIPDDIPEPEKWQQIKQMYKKANLLKKKRRPLHLIVNTKAGARNPTAKAPKGAKVKIVDRRMKSDLRAAQRGAHKNRRSVKSSKGGHRGKPVKLLAHKPRRGGRVKRRPGSGH